MSLKSELMSDVQVSILATLIKTTFFIRIKMLRIYSLLGWNNSKATEKVENSSKPRHNEIKVLSTPFRASEKCTL